MMFIQAETSKKPTAVGTAPRHRVRKTLSAASFFGKFVEFCCDEDKKSAQLEAKERKLWTFEERQSISSLEPRQAWTRPEPQIA